MYIVNQDRTAVYNFERFMGLSLSGRQIYLDDSTLENAIVLGTYATPERAQEVFKVMIDKWFSFDGENDKRYMPEK